MARRRAATRPPAGARRHAPDGEAGRTPGGTRPRPSPSSSPSPQASHTSGVYLTISSGSWTRPRCAPGAPGCLPARRPAFFSRLDWRPAACAARSARVSPEGGFELSPSGGPNSCANSATRASSRSITRCWDSTNARNSGDRLLERLDARVVVGHMTTFATGARSLLPPSFNTRISQVRGPEQLLSMLVTVSPAPSCPCGGQRR